MLDIVVVFLELLAKWILKQKGPFMRLAAQSHLFRELTVEDQRHTRHYLRSHTVGSSLLLICTMSLELDVFLETSRDRCLKHLEIE